jgi:hypothetical protein
MKRVWFLLASGVLVATVLGGCNNVGSCPAPSAIQAGGSCSGDNLECPYTLETLSPVCDGTTIEGGLATSCVCQGGSWSCPSVVSCDGGEATVEDADDAAPLSDGAGATGPSDAGDATVQDASDAVTPPDASDSATIADAANGSQG